MCVYAPYFLIHPLSLCLLFGVVAERLCVAAVHEGLLVTHPAARHLVSRGVPGGDGRRNRPVVSRHLGKVSPLLLATESAISHDHDHFLRVSLSSER
jgi:hypothetical protein